MLKLRPCPFCGGKAEIIPQTGGWLMARCSECGANRKEFTKYKRQIAAAWNQREVKEGFM